MCMTSEVGKYLFRAANVGGCMRSSLLLPLVRCIYVCLWHMFYMSVVVTVLGSVGMFVVWWL